MLQVFVWIGFVVPDIRLRRQGWLPNRIQHHYQLKAQEQKILKVKVLCTLCYWPTLLIFRLALDLNRSIPEHLSFCLGFSCLSVINVNLA